jgi:hypothetical protein
MLILTNKNMIPLPQRGSLCKKNEKRFKISTEKIGR